MKLAATVLFLLSTLTAVSAQTAHSYALCEDTCTHVHGIDISHYQGDVFWERVGENAKIAYVYIKATEGGDNVDETYVRNLQLANKNGLKVGSYHFFRPKTPVQKQAENFMSQCKPKDQDLIPMIDIESTGGLTTEAFCDSLFKFLNIIEKAYKQRPLLYTFTNFYNKYLVGTLQGYKLMIAQYTLEEPRLLDDMEITMWQYTGKGSIDGINGFVDKSRLTGSHSLRELRYRR